ncbi:family 43 glycosylhydrolase [Thermophagus sp. OGC60D27]|uniref:family 43 glycosylhydrolase n=1 Tax=Thermophagus sp. OGC60D27 TaxID=3458415 RepID=UPI004037F040
MKKYSVFIVLVFAIVKAWSGPVFEKKVEYPFQNPVIQNCFTASPSVHVFPDGRLWMLASIDEAQTDAQKPQIGSFRMYSSSDVKNWTDHGEVFNIVDLNTIGDSLSLIKTLGSGDVVFRDGMYYLFFSYILQEGDVEKECIGVAYSKRPDKRFKLLQRSIENVFGGHPSVFVDSDGKFYLLWGNKMCALLDRSMTNLASAPFRFYLEGDDYLGMPWLFKYDGCYYLSYQTKYLHNLNAESIEDPFRKKSNIYYQISDNIQGPYRQGGVLNFELGANIKTGPQLPGKSFVPWRLNHSNEGCVVNYHEKKYLFYHNSALSSWIDFGFKDAGGDFRRSVCIDEIIKDQYDVFLPVRQTLGGVQSTGINQPYRIDLDSDSVIHSNSVLMENGTIQLSQKEGWIKFKGVAMGSGYYYFGLRNLSEALGSVEVFLDDCYGQLIGTLLLSEKGNESEKINSPEYALLIGAKGKKDLCLKFTLENPKEEVFFDSASLIAGKPLPLSPSIRISEPSTGTSLLFNETVDVIINEKSGAGMQVYDSLKLYVNGREIAFPHENCSEVSNFSVSGFSDLKNTIAGRNQNHPKEIAFSELFSGAFNNINNSFFSEAGKYKIKVIGYSNGISNEDQIVIWRASGEEKVFFNAERYSKIDEVFLQKCLDDTNQEKRQTKSLIINGHGQSTYLINIPESGTYYLSARTATEKADCSIVVKTEHGEVGEINVPLTGGDMDYSFTSAIALELKKGFQNIHFEFINSRGVPAAFRFNGFQLKVKKQFLAEPADCVPFVKIYPNPASTRLFFETGFTDDFTISFYSYSSRLIYSLSVENPTGNIDLSNMPKGQYVVRFQSEDYSVSKKLIIK